MSVKDSVLSAPKHIAAIAPYQAGKPIEELAREFGLDASKIVKLASNENPLGMPESAKQALSAAVANLGRYPDPSDASARRETPCRASQRPRT
jgi:histidinol-phosphate aminotransferase